MRGVDVAHFEAGALAGETTRPEGREASLVRDLGERVRLWSMNCDSCDDPKYSFTTAETGLALMRSCGISVSISCDMLMRSLMARSDTNQTDAVLVLHQLAHRADAAVAEMVDVVDRSAAVLQLDEVAHRLQDVLGRAPRDRAGLLIRDDVAVELVVELETADLREVVALGVEEQVVEEGLRRLERGGSPGRRRR